MTNGDGRGPNGEIGALTSEPLPTVVCPEPAPDLPKPWQPLTPRGIAAFSRAGAGRLLFVQFVVAGLTGGAVIWFLTTAWFPVILQAIRQLPETGGIVAGRLVTPRESVLPLAENRFMAFFADATARNSGAVSSDLRVTFGREDVSLCSLLGCVRIKYPATASVALSRPELQSWWSAWQPVFLTVAGLASAVVVFLSWGVLATLYGPAAWMLAYLKDRQLTMPGAWKLAAAAQLPGALVAGVSIVLYGLGVLDLLRFLVLWALHFPLAWGCAIAAVLALPRVGAAGPVRNPFTTDDDDNAGKRTRRNPFAALRARVPRSGATGSQTGGSRISRRNGD